MALSQTFTTWSAPPDASNFPSGLKATTWTRLVCPVKVRTKCPVSASQSWTVLSTLAVARNFPSGLNVTHQTTLF